MHSTKCGQTLCSALRVLTPPRMSRTIMYTFSLATGDKVYLSVAYAYDSSTAIAILLNFVSSDGYARSDQHHYLGTKWNSHS